MYRGNFLTLERACFLFVFVHKCEHVQMHNRELLCLFSSSAGTSSCVCSLKENFGICFVDRSSSSLHRENKTARNNVAGDKLRAAFLRRKINTMQRKRTKARADQIYRTAKPGEVPTKEERMQVGCFVCVFIGRSTCFFF